jgi:hypothetical protein
MNERKSVIALGKERERENENDSVRKKTQNGIYSNNESASVRKERGEDESVRKKMRTVFYSSLRLTRTHLSRRQL